MRKLLPIHLYNNILLLSWTSSTTTSSQVLYVDSLTRIEFLCLLFSFCECTVTSFFVSPTSSSFVSCEEKSEEAYCYTDNISMNIYHYNHVSVHIFLSFPDLPPPSPRADILCLSVPAAPRVSVYFSFPLLPVCLLPYSPSCLTHTHTIQTWIYKYYWY